MIVLVVDDSHFNLSVAKRYLDAIPDISRVFLCDDSRQVSTLLKEYPIDILISDVMMPAITGFDLLKLIKADKQYDDMPVIMLTSLNDEESYKKCFELGAFDYINKPIDVVELNSRLKVAIASRKSSNHLKSLLEVTKKQNEELKEMNAQLTEAKFSLVQSEKMAAIGQLAAGIAHEINNPMGYISSNFSILQKYFLRMKEYLEYQDRLIKEGEFDSNSTPCPGAAKLSEKYQSLKLEIILGELEAIFKDTENGIERITEIVQSLRVYARTSKDDEKTTNDLLDLVQQVILITNNEVKYVANIELDVPDDTFLYCNRIQISQVLINLILNAAQAIKAQKKNRLGKIKMKARTIGQEIRIEIKDDGPGIPEENLFKIFEPFFTTKEIGQGTGLGLSISYDIIVNKHKGSIDVKSELGKGATFTIMLPIVT